MSKETFDAWMRDAGVLIKSHLEQEPMNKLTDERIAEIQQEYATWDRDAYYDILSKSELNLLIAEVREGRRAVEVVRSPIGGDAEMYGWSFTCPECRKILIRNRDNFCPDCGVKLTWKDEP